MCVAVNSMEMSEGHLVRPKQTDIQVLVKFRERLISGRKMLDGIEMCPYEINLFQPKNKQKKSK